MTDRPAGSRLRVVEIEAKSIIVPSRLPDTDVVVNPYVGCSFGCAYCYASFMGRMVDEPISAWGSYVYVKTNAVDLMELALAKMSAAKRERRMLLSSVTDPYQGVERRYRLTRGILERLAHHGYPGLVGILTKSPMVTRDIDLLTQLQRVEVGMTVTTTDDKVSRWLEVRAPVTSRRLHGLARLHEAGIPTYAFVGPLLPHFAEYPHLLDELFGRLAGAGVSELYIEFLNTKRYIRDRLSPVLDSEPERVRVSYEQSRSIDHKARLVDVVTPLLTKHQLTLRLGAVLSHDEGVPVDLRRNGQDERRKP